MHDTLRPLCESEQVLVSKYVYEHVATRLGDNYLWNLADVVNTMTLYGITRAAPDPGSILNYWDMKVRVVSEMVSNYLINSYRGIAEFGMIDRARHLHRLARNHI